MTVVMKSQKARVKWLAAPSSQAWLSSERAPHCQQGSVHLLTLVTERCVQVHQARTPEHQHCRATRLRHLQRLQRTPLLASCPVPEKWVVRLGVLVDLQLIQRELSHGSRFTERHHDRTGTLGPALARLCRQAEARGPRNLAKEPSHKKQRTPRTI